MRTSFTTNIFVHIMLHRVSWNSVPHNFFGKFLFCNSFMGKTDKVPNFFQKKKFLQKFLPFGHNLAHKWNWGKLKKCTFSVWICLNWGQNILSEFFGKKLFLLIKIIILIKFLVEISVMIAYFGDLGKILQFCIFFRYFMKNHQILLPKIFLFTVSLNYVTQTNALHGM